jgi:CheY-like chemotaxis protein/tRNA A-37 threonylcarbamoyl transferase component Bud32
MKSGCAEVEPVDARFLSADLPGSDPPASPSGMTSSPFDQSLSLLFETIAQSSIPDTDRISIICLSAITFVDQCERVDKLDAGKRTAVMAKILYVDDDCDLARSVGRNLSCMDHTVTIANTGLEGWNSIKSNQYDLVILDWEMPDLNGIELLKLLRSGDINTPVIMMTGRSALNDRVHGLQSGANDYMTKPFEIEELAARINAALRACKAAAPPPPKSLGTNNEAVLKRADLAGTALAARFEFLDLIAEGGSAMVFKCRHPQLSKLVAIKMLIESEFSEEAIARFEQEARVISNLEHQNILIVHDFGVTERKQPYMVMELIDGPSLHNYVESKGYLPLKEALPIVISIGDGLAYAHERGILHRDIKPGNIMLKQVSSQQVVPKILDFGLAKLLSICAHKAAIHTQAQQFIGSPPYMSPEQVRGKQLDERSDIYSLGCLLFEVVTGCLPFTGEDPVEIAFKHIEEPPLSFAQVRPEVKYPPTLELLLAKAMEKDPARRYQTVRELNNELARLLATLNDRSIWTRVRKIF